MRIESKALFAVLAYAIAAAWSPAFWAVTVPSILLLALALIRIGRGSPLALSWAWAIALIGVVQIVTGTSAYLFQTEAAILSWVAYGAVAWLAARADAPTMLPLLAYLAGAVALFAILVPVTSTFHIFWIFPVRYPLVFGPYVYRNHYAAFAELMLAPALYLACKRREQRALFVFIAAALFAGVIVAESRAGTILITCETLAVLAIVTRRRLLSGRAAAALAIALCVGAAAVGFTGLNQRFHEQNAYHVRAEILKSSFDMWRARPIAGWGLGTWRTMYPSYARIDPGVIVNEAHNDWAQWACDGGTLAVLVMLSLAFWSAWRGVQSIWGLGVSVVFVHALVDYPFQEPSIMFLAMVIVGLMLSCPRRRGAPSLV
jgi:hypothetical protein